MYINTSYTGIIFVHGSIRAEKKYNYLPTYIYQFVSAYIYTIFRVTYISLYIVIIEKIK